MEVGHLLVFNEFNKDGGCKLPKSSIVFANSLICGFLQKVIGSQERECSIDTLPIWVNSVAKLQDGNNEVIIRMIQNGHKWVIENEKCYFEFIIKSIYTGLNDDCCKWLSGALEYLAAEIYELAVQMTKSHKRIIVKEKYIMAAIVNDTELNDIFEEQLKRIN